MIGSRLALPLFIYFAIIAAPEEPQGRAISGSVVEGGTDRPVVGVAVVLRYPRGLQTAKTDEQGKFAFWNVLPGPVQLGLGRPSLGQGGRTQTASPLTLLGPSVFLTLQPDNDIHNIKLIQSNGVIDGTILTSRGVPAADVAVDIVRKEYDIAGICKLQTVMTSRTDDRGQYRVFGLHPGEYYVRAENLPGVNEPQLRSKTFAPGTTDILRAQRLVLSQNEEATIDVTISTTVTTSVSGRITGADNTGMVARIEVTKMEDCQSGVPSRFLTTHDSFQGIIAEGPGRYEFDVTLAPIVAGSDEAMTALQTRFNTGRFSTVKTLSGRSIVSVSGQGANNVTLQVHQLTSWNGTVIISPGSAGITLHNLRAVVLHPAGIYPEGLLDSNSYFTMPRRVNGKQYVTIAGLPPDSYIADVQIDGISSPDWGIESFAGEKVEVYLDSRGAQLAGRVRNATGEPAQLATTVLVPMDRRGTPVLFKVVSTDSLGNFEFRGIKPGDYKIFAWGNVPDLAWHSGTYLSQFESEGTPIRVLAGKNESDNVQLITDIPSRR